MIWPRIHRRPSRPAPATAIAAVCIVSRGHSLGDPSQPTQMSQSSRKTYDYYAFGRPAGYALSGGAGGSPAEPLSSVTYAYDLEGAKGSGGAGGSPADPDATVAYSYDTLGRMVRNVFYSKNRQLTIATDLWHNSANALSTRRKGHDNGRKHYR